MSMRTVCNKINNHIIRHELMYDVQMLEANKEVFFNIEMFTSVKYRKHNVHL